MPLPQANPQRGGTGEKRSISPKTKNNVKNIKNHPKPLKKASNAKSHPHGMAFWCCKWLDGSTTILDILVLIDTPLTIKQLAAQNKRTQ